MGFNVETYQITKKNCNGGNSAGVSQEVLDRLDNLENNQMKVHKEFYYDFSTYDYTDRYKTNVNFINDGIMARQYLFTVRERFETDDIVDWDYSFGVKVKDGTVLFDLPSTINGELHTFYYEVNKAIGFRISPSYRNKYVLGNAESIDMIQGCLWFASEVDRYGRLWVISCAHFKNAGALDVSLTIYNKDLTVYKTHSLDHTKLFYNNNSYTPLHGSGKLSFTDQNLCLIHTVSLSGTSNGATASSGSVRAESISIIDEDGNHRFLHSRTLHGTNGNYYHTFRGGYKAHMMYRKRQVFAQTGGFYACLSGGYQGHAPAQISGYECPLGINSISDTIRLSKQLGVAHNQYNTGWTSRHDGNMFYKNDYFYIPTTSWLNATTGLPLQHTYMQEARLDASNNQIMSSKSNTNPTLFNIRSDNNYNGVVIYGHNGLNGMYYREKTDQIYYFGNGTNAECIMHRFDVDINDRSTSNINVSNMLYKSINLPCTTYDSNRYAESYHMPLKVIDDGYQLHLLYVGITSDTNSFRSLRYMSVDYDLNVLTSDTIIYTSTSNTDDQIINFDGHIVDGNLEVLFSTGQIAAPTLNNPKNHIYRAHLSRMSTDIKFYYATNEDLTWRLIDDISKDVVLNKAADGIKFRVVFNSPQYDVSPELRALDIEYWNNDNQVSRVSEYHSTRIPTIQNDGKGVLTSECDPGDGTIDWFLSYDGGENYSPIKLGEEFIYNHISAPDFRVKAVLAVKDNAKKAPVVNNYRLTTSHVVLHSDIEQIQLSLIKTNFKIDTYTRASKNGLYKMTIDTFSDDENIDYANSSCIYSLGGGFVSGDFMQSIPERINSSVNSILLTVDEECDTSVPNSRIDYFVSADGGKTFKQIEPEQKVRLKNTSSATTDLVFRAVFHNGARLSAWGWAWD